MSSTAARVLAGALLVALAVIIGSSVAGSGGGAGSAPPGASSLDSGSGGLSKWAALLELRGHDVERRLDPPSSADLDPGETAVLLDAGELSPVEERDLGGFLDRGGRLVVGGDLSLSTQRRLAGTRVATTGEPGPTEPLVPVRETKGVEQVTGSDRLYDEAGATLPVLGLSDGQSLLVTASVGEQPGQLLLLSDSGPLTNSKLGEEDNARFAANLGGDPSRRVVFIEDTGTEPDTGLAALPAGWGWAALLLLVAALTMIASQLRRLGPPDRPERELPPPRRRYVDAIGGSLARTKASHRAAEPLREAGLQRLRAMTGSDQPSADMLARVGREAGLTTEEMTSLSKPLADDDDAVLTGRALAKLWR